MATNAIIPRYPARKFGFPGKGVGITSGNKKNSTNEDDLDKITGSQDEGELSFLKKQIANYPECGKRINFWL